MNRTQNLKYYLAVLVSLITFLVYLACLRNEFVNWDDDLYVFENQHIRSFDFAFFRWAFFDFSASNWHPLTWISHALDYAIWGLNPLGHHLTSILLHAVNTFLVVMLVTQLLEALKERMLGSEQAPFPNEQSIPITAGVTGLLFGLHPVHVESVAWVAERKDLLCALFFLLSIVLYIKYAGVVSNKMYGKNTASRFFNMHYLVSLVFFILALLSKPMAVTLPVVLLILDGYPFQRIGSLGTFLKAVVEKLPFVAFSVASSVVTIMAQKAGGAMQPLAFVPFSTRALVGGASLVSYLGKMIWPLNLAPYYPYPEDAFSLSSEYLFKGALMVAITISCLLVIKRRVWLSVWSYFIVTLIPVLGIVQVGSQSMADRYTYLPSLGPFLVIGLVAAGVLIKINTLAKWTAGIKIISITIVVLMMVSLSYLTIKQIGRWKDDLDFWTYILEVEPTRLPFAYRGRGLAFVKMGQLDTAIADYNKALILNPSYYEAYNNRGAAFAKMGQLDRAIADYNKALILNPSYYEAYNNRGAAFAKMGQLDRAIADYDKALTLNPFYYEAYYNRGAVFYKMGQLDRAIADYNKALTLNPSYYEAYNNRGVAFYVTGQLDRAIADYNKALILNPSYYEAYYNRGIAFYKSGQLHKATKDFDKAKAVQLFH